MNLKLTLDVKYIPNGVTATELKRLLAGIVSHAMSEGLVTGDTEAEVESHSVEIEETLADEIAEAAAILAASIDQGDEDMQEAIDEEIHDYKSQEASEINNGGYESQFQFLLEQNLIGPDGDLAQGVARMKELIERNS